MVSPISLCSVLVTDSPRHYIRVERSLGYSQAITGEKKSVKETYNINDSFIIFSIRCSFALIPTTQFLVNDLMPSASRRIDWSRFLIKTGLKTLSSNWPYEPATLMVVLLPMT